MLRASIHGSRRGLSHWQAPHSTFMKDFKAAYELMYKRKLELAQNPEQLKAYRKELFEKAEPPSTELMATGEKVVEVPLATRCG